MRKEKGRFFLICGLLAWLLLLLESIAAFPMMAAEAVSYGNGRIDTVNNVYQIDMKEDNTLTVSASYYSNPNVVVSYHTEYLCITKNRTHGTPRSGSSPYKTFYVGNHNIQVYGSVSYDTFEVPADEFVSAIREWFTTEELTAPEGVTVYLNDLFVKKTRSSAGGDWVFHREGRLYDTLD